MDAKKESKIILSALDTIPLGAGIALIIGGQATGWLLIILAIIIFIWLWKPWTWFQKKEKHGHKK